MKLNEVELRKRVLRARSAVGRGIRYRLGHGGVFPIDILPTRSGFCDCSGFVAWVLQLSRMPKASRPFWLETTNIYRDATGKQKAFIRITNPVPGCVVVYPDTKALGVKREGHIGLVTEVKPDGSYLLVDCSSSQGGKTKEAIREWDRTKLFRSRNAIFVVLKQDYVVE